MTTPAQPIPKSDNIPLAVGVILFAVLSLSLGDAIIKLTNGTFGIWQVFLLRSVIVVPILILVIALINPTALRLPRALGATLLRSALLVAMWISYYIALPHLSFSAAAAAYYTLPIFITLFSAALLGERIKTLGWIAVLLGFLGVLLILRPQAASFNWYALLPLLSAMLYAFAMILTRSKCRDENPLILALTVNIGFALAGALTAAYVALQPDATFLSFPLAKWAPMGQAEWISMAVLSTAILIGTVGAAFAYQKAPASLIGTFDFAYVGFATLWGILFFADIPDALTLAGMALITTAGILSLRQ